MTQPILIAQDLRKSYGEFEAVKGISLQVARGEVFGLLGPNGAGKTTTISMLTALLEPTGGKITVDGLDLKAHTNEIKAKMGLVPQEMALYMSLSARENLMFFGRIYGLKGKELRQRVDEVLEMIGLTERADEAVEKYSGGMKRRVNIGAGLLHKPEILFLDEPTVGVDPQSRNAIFESVEALNQAGMSVIYTTHYMEEAQRLCHRVAIVDEGELIAQDTPTALIRSLGGGVIMLGVAEGAPDDLAERVAQIPAVKSATRRDTDPAGSTGGQLKIETQRLQEGLMGALDVTNQLDVRVTSLEILEPNLESVFLHLTGKKLRQ
ncbi:MAG: ATP-binding cassette domain-containing protein [Anaerolineae bacterium]|jgi:ABC-2 type transport system ATP-binding protein